MSNQTWLTIGACMLILQGCSLAPTYHEQKPLSPLQTETLTRYAIKEHVAEANWLKEQYKYQSYLKEIKRLDWWQDSRENILLQQQTLANTLLKLSQEAMDQAQYTLAQLAHEQASELDEKIKRQANWKAISNQLSQQNKNRRQRLLVATSQSLRKALNEENVDTIRQLENKIRQQGLSGSTIKALLKRADNLKQQKFNEHEAKGNRFYRLGNIDAAIEEWKNAQRWLSDRSTLNDKLQRAQKIQQKLESIRQSQSN